MRRRSKSIDPVLQVVEGAALEAARRLNSEWPQDWRKAPSGEAWPDGGWAMIRGLVIRLFYEELAEAIGMWTTRLELAFPELLMTFMRMRGELHETIPELGTLTPEHFGHVHETLVGFGLAGGEVVDTRGRKKTGAFFTPPHLAMKVTDTTLRPLLATMESDGLGEPLGRRVLHLKICDPAVGAGAFLLAVVRRLAPYVLIDGGARDLHEAKRLVAINCCHGVDVDRYAVLATKLALTLECRANRMPSSWLDHAIHHGDGLVGLANNEQLLAMDWRPNASPQRPLERWQDELIQGLDEAARAISTRRAELAKLARSAT